MAVEQQIAVALYHRDGFSRGSSRKIIAHDAYHWGIYIAPEVSKEGDCLAVEATDASEIDPVTWRMRNPTMVWWLRIRKNDDPEIDTKLLGRIVLGEAPPGVSMASIQQALEQVPLPMKNTNPQQSCVSWVVDVIKLFQEKQWLPIFDIDKFKDSALGFADGLLREEGSRGKAVTYEAIQR